MVKRSELYEKAFAEQNVMVKKLNELQDENKRLRDDIYWYLRECDNPVPDGAHRHHLRERLREALKERKP